MGQTTNKSKTENQQISRKLKIKVARNRRGNRY